MKIVRCDGGCGKEAPAEQGGEYGPPAPPEGWFVVGWAKREPDLPSEADVMMATQIGAFESLDNEQGAKAAHAVRQGVRAAAALRKALRRNVPAQLMQAELCADCFRSARIETWRQVASTTLSVLADAE